LLGSDLNTAWGVHDVIGIVSTTRCHTSDTVARLFQIGGEAFTLYLTMFPKLLDVQSYLYATLIEMPMQVKMYFDFCEASGLACDTSSLNCQNSEHVNAVLKGIEKRQSSHKRRTGEDGTTMDAHTDSRCFRAFLAEYGTADLALSLGLLSGQDIAGTEERHRNCNRILPETSECRVCGEDALVCAQVCGHPWMTSGCFEELKKGNIPTMVSLMQNPVLARAHVVVKPTTAPKQKKEKTQNVSTEQKKMRETRNKPSNTRKKPGKD